MDVVVVLLFAFTNKVYNLKTRTFAPHFKFDYVLTHCGREWHAPTAAQLDKVRAVIESTMPDAGERKMLISVLRNGLSGVRPEHMRHALPLRRVRARWAH